MGKEAASGPRSPRIELRLLRLGDDFDSNANTPPLASARFESEDGRHVWAHFGDPGDEEAALRKHEAPAPYRGRECPICFEPLAGARRRIRRIGRLAPRAVFA
eukprot:gene8068-12645_t